MTVQLQSSIVDRKSPRLLTFASGGWVLVLTAALSLALIAMAIVPAIMQSVNRPPGDGVNIHSYGFDLSGLAVPESEIRPALKHRDMAPTLTNPTASTPDQTQRLNDPKRGKYLVSSDPVIGVELNGQARAYPIHVMYVNEIINDTLAGIPIAVTHHWPSGSTMVFDRRVANRTIEFGVSGLVYNSNLLMYDRKAASRDGARVHGDESLWSQMLARAFSGQAADSSLQLKTLAYEISRWDDWLARHPNTTIINRDVKLIEWYKGAAPTSYLKSDDLLFPVNPLPPASGPPAKTPVIAVIAGSHRCVYTLPFLMKSAGESGLWTDTLGDITLRFTMNRQSQTVRVETDSPTQEVRAFHAYWFAWHAMHPGDQLAQ
ncbi:MAG: DUF3179 domain-containing protein [Phycisphaerales bacterium]|nr:DUF3179 domain-containing protein [Phycisphaerales bacterium]MCI0632029.1 DUF3179 domain-containing protein [Phycisphaerales bacterium]